MIILQPMYSVFPPSVLRIRSTTIANQPSHRIQGYVQDRNSQSRTPKPAHITAHLGHPQSPNAPLPYTFLPSPLQSISPNRPFLRELPTAAIQFPSTHSLTIGIFLSSPGQQDIHLLAGHQLHPHPQHCEPAPVGF